tara:strand:+ start:803 stop:1714 length:912 start_codon:yes stop_codon:yes gene_type:complete
MTLKKNVLILGGSGMLGIEVLRELINIKNIILHVTIRNLKDKRLIQKYLDCNISNIKFYKFKIEGSYKGNLKKITKGKQYIVNCIGIIKPYINEENHLSIENALLVNSIFPHVLKNSVTAKVKIFQIATDCVYDGAKGKYNENESHNATDVYGKSKSLGEVSAKNFFNLRCSIIGKEIKSYKSLLCWFLNQKKDAKIFGFKNHLWNGITTKHFAKIVTVLILKDVKIPNLLHLVPGDIVNKYELLKIFQNKFQRHDLEIFKTNAKVIVNRTLTTNHKDINKKINKILGLKNLIAIKKIVNEII